jgi:hypothetical protein
MNPWQMCEAATEMNPRQVFDGATEMNLWTELQKRICICARDEEFI